MHVARNSNKSLCRHASYVKVKECFTFSFIDFLLVLVCCIIVYLFSLHLSPVHQFFICISFYFLLCDNFTNLCMVRNAHAQ